MSAPGTFTETCILPCDWPNTLFHADVLELCRRYGYNPKDVAWIEFEVIDAPLLRFCIYQRNEDDQLFMDPMTKQVARKLAEHLLEQELPSWWKPEIRS